MDDEWSIQVKNFGTVRISYDFLSRLSGYRQVGLTIPESGGVVIGRHLNSGGALLIEAFTPPQKSDSQGRCLFFRSQAHNALVQNIWQESNHYSTYVGLWHTHPEPIPNYSITDKRDWLKALNKSQFQGKRLFFFIVGQTHIKCWVGLKRIIRNKIELVGEFKFDI